MEEADAEIDAYLTDSIRSHQDEALRLTVALPIVRAPLAWSWVRQRRVLEGSDGGSIHPSFKKGINTLCRPP